MSFVDSIERFAQKYGSTMGRICIFAVLAFLWLPIGVVTLMSFAKEGVFSFPPEEFTLEWYSVFINNPQAIDAVITSFKVSIPATIVSVLLSSLIAYSITRYEFPGRNYVQTLATLPIIVPLIVVGVAMVLFFGTLNMQAGYQTVFIAHIVRTIPFGTLILVATFLGFDQTLEEASMDLGASELRTFRKVTLPNILPGIIAASLISFTMSFNEFIYTFFVRDSSTTTVPIYIWQRVRFEVTPEVNVMSVVFLLLAIGLVLIAVGLTRVERLTLQ